jgi:hypothetical protein
MHKIKYPTDSKDLEKFEKAFYDCLSNKNESNIDLELNKITCSKGKKLSFERLVKMTFNELQDIEQKILNHINVLPKIQKTKPSGKSYDTTEFEQYFDYSKNQGKIAKFFMKANHLNMKTCYYCGIDFINTFNHLPNYDNKKDFINNAKPHEFLFVKDMGYADAKEIINNRPYQSASDLKISTENISKLRAFKFSLDHNHFTLDHVIPQSTHKFFSLCLYNFVPSCYSCNSKFKKDLKFLGLDEDLKFISPTSPDYSFAKDYQFELFFAKQFQDVNSVDDFFIQDKIKNNHDHVGSYLKMFKILGRYSFHKDIILELIEKKIKYPESKIRNLSKKTGLSQMELRKRIFGKDLFVESIKEQAMIKFKRDAAKSIGIKGVIE